MTVLGKSGTKRAIAAPSVRTIKTHTHTYIVQHIVNEGRGATIDEVYQNHKAPNLLVNMYITQPWPLMRAILLHRSPIFVDVDDNAVARGT